MRSQKEVAMSARANELADQFQAANADVVAFVSTCDDATWNVSCEGEGWSIGAVAAHIADGHHAVAGWIRAIVAGQPITMTAEDLHAGNAARATTNAAQTRERVLRALRERGTAAADLVRSLDDDDLARGAPFGILGGKIVSAANLIERTLIAHPQRHLASMRASAGNS
jgi:uncharacterized damage-inducible protein DinB